MQVRYTSIRRNMQVLFGMNGGGKMQSAAHRGLHERRFGERAMSILKRLPCGTEACNRFS